MATKSIGIDIREATGQGAGKARYCEELTKALITIAPKNVQFKLFTKRHNSHFASSEQVEQVAIPGSGPFWHWQLKKYLQANPVDIFLSPTSYIYPAIAPKNQACVPVIHDLIALVYPEKHHWFSTWVERLTIRRAIRKSPFLISVSNASLRELHRVIPSSADKEALIAAPAVSEHFQPLTTKSMDLPEDYLLWVGTIHPRKNLKTVLQAFKKIHKSAPNLHLCIAGAPGWKMSENTSHIHHKNIHMLGYVSDEQLVELYSRARALVYLSLYEGFGMPALEAMACDCPVITGNVSSLPEVVGDAAIQIDPTDEQALEEAVRTLFEVPKRKALIEKGRARAKEFSWEKSAKVILDRLLK